MRAGIFGKRIYIYREYKSVNEYGETIKGVFRQIYSTRAEVTLPSGGRAVENDNTVYNVSKQFKMRSYVNVQDYDRILFENEYYNVININKFEHEQYILVDTEKIMD